MLLLEKIAVLFGWMLASCDDDAVLCLFAGFTSLLLCELFRSKCVCVCVCCVNFLNQNVCVRVCVCVCVCDLLCCMQVDLWVKMSEFLEKIDRMPNASLQRVGNVHMA